jgi:hypothetical protein
VGRSDDLLEQCVGDAIGVVGRVDDEKIDCADEAAGPDRRPQRQHGSTHDLAPDLRDEDARLREIDQLSEQVARITPSLNATSRSMSVMRAVRI